MLLLAKRAETRPSFDSGHGEDYHNTLRSRVLPPQARVQGQVDRVLNMKRDGDQRLLCNQQVLAMLDAETLRPATAHTFIAPHFFTNR